MRQKKDPYFGDGQRKKDWHNKEAIRRDSERVGMYVRLLCMF